MVDRQDVCRQQVAAHLVGAARVAPHQAVCRGARVLLQLTGVGAKVADCICLMALDKHDVVPVDTHVLQIAVRDYKYRGRVQ